MKILKPALYFTFAASLLTACGESPKQSSTDTTEETENAAVSDACMYSYIADSTDLRWTAYKFTEKTGVSGTFDNIAITGTQSADNIREVFKYAVFSIPIKSINSADPERDPKVIKHFFGTMKDTDKLEGKVVKLGENTADVAIKLNSVIDTLQFEMKIEGEHISLESVMELGNWNALPSVEKLNEICRDLHIGADGVSKLWPEVKLELSTTVNKKCK